MINAFRHQRFLHQYCLLAVGASYLHSRTAAITPNGRDYFSALPIRSRAGEFLLFSLRWGVGPRHLGWVETGEWAYPLMGPFEVDTMDIAENRRAWRWKEAARAALLTLFEGSVSDSDRLVPCGTLFDWWTVKRLVRGS